MPKRTVGARLFGFLLLLRLYNLPLQVCLCPLGKFFTPALYNSSVKFVI
jgi:hypothetical protein